MASSNLVYRQSAQVISKITDLSQIDTRPEYAFFGCVTASKGDLNSPYMIPGGNLTLLESYLGKVTAAHSTLMAAARAIEAGAPAYLVRVASKSAGPAYASVKDSKDQDLIKLTIKNVGTDGNEYSITIQEESTLPPKGTQTMKFRPSGPAGESGDPFDYEQAYKDCSVTLADGVMRYIKPETVSIPPELFHGPYPFVGLTFAKPAGATMVTMAINGTPTAVDIDLTKDGDSVVNGEFVSYFAFAEGDGEYLPDGKWVLDFNWITPDGTLATTCTLVRRSGEPTKAYKLTLYRDELVQEENIVSMKETDSNYILDTWSDYYEVEPIGEVNGAELTEGTIKFHGGNDGVADIKAEDFIGKKITGNYTGVYTFLDLRLRGQLIATLGYTEKSYIIAMRDVADIRKDLNCILDTPAGLTFNQVRNWINSEGPYMGDLTLNGFNMEVYWDWQKDEWDGNPVILPPSSYVVENTLKSYKENKQWYPVAGDERGKISSLEVVTRIDEVTDRDTLVTNRINPIHDTGVRGIQIYGNETLNHEYSDLSAAHIARTLVFIRSTVDNYTETRKFELNDDILWSEWIDHVTQKVLQPIKDARGLQWFRATMGRDLTTREELAQRKVRGRVELQFTPDAEIFYLDYIVYSSAADMEAEEG